MEVELEGIKLRVHENGVVEKWSKWRKLWLSTKYMKPNSQGYKTIQLWNGKHYTYTVHRIVAWVFLDLDIHNSTQQVDHIDRNRLNNHITNLRIVSSLQNNWNLPPCKGYTLNKINNKWKAQIRVKGKQIWLGDYDTENEASQAYKTAKQTYHVICP